MAACLSSARFAEQQAMGKKCGWVEDRSISNLFWRKFSLQSQEIIGNKSCLDCPSQPSTQLVKRWKMSSPSLGARFGPLMVLKLQGNPEGCP